MPPQKNPITFEQECTLLHPCELCSHSLRDNDRGCAGICEAPEGSGWMMQSTPERSKVNGYVKPLLRSGVDAFCCRTMLFVSNECYNYINDMSDICYGGSSIKVCKFRSHGLEQDIWNVSVLEHSQPNGYHTNQRGLSFLLFDLPDLCSAGVQIRKLATLRSG